MHSRLAELRAFVDAQRSALLSAASPVPPDRWTERPAPECWSLTELFEHLYRVENVCARVVEKRALEAREAGHPPENETSSVLGALDGTGLTDRSRKLAAPERVAPIGGWTREQALESLARSRATLHDGMRAADGLALGTVKAPHPRLGEIDLYQWILFIGQHEQRHVAQAAEIAERLAAPVR
ncbi:MAG: DinB family protein [Gemmatimonadaceae bacterium]